MMNEHLFHKFDDELKKLRYRLVKMGTLVQQQVELAINSLITNNLDFANLVFELEDKIDKMDIKINNQCFRMIALHQPVAKDLRVILTGYQLNLHFEIIADNTTNIIKDVKNMLCPPELIAMTKIKEMTDTINLMVSKLIDAFVDLNFDLAIETLHLVKEVSILYHENFKLLTEIMKNDSKYIEPCVYLHDINRNFHTINHQIRNIAEELVFLLDSRIVKHQKLDEIITNEQAVTKVEESLNN